MFCLYLFRPYSIQFYQYLFLLKATHNCLQSKRMRSWTKGWSNNFHCMDCLKLFSHILLPMQQTFIKLNRIFKKSIKIHVFYTIITCTYMQYILQAIVDHHIKLMKIYAECVHDACYTKRLMQKKIAFVDNYKLAANAYPLRTWLITPFRTWEILPLRKLVVTRDCQDQNK